MSNQEAFNRLKSQVEDYEQSELVANRPYTQLVASTIFTVLGVVGIILITIGSILGNSAFSIGLVIFLTSVPFYFNKLKPIVELLHPLTMYFFGEKIHSRIAIQKRNIVSILRRDIYLLTSMKHFGGEWESIAARANKILAENEIKYVVTELTIE